MVNGRRVVMSLAVSAALGAFAGVAVVAYVQYFSSIEFDSHRWKNEPSTRWRQIDDLHARFLSERWDAGRLFDELGSHLPGETRDAFIARVLATAGTSYSVNQAPSVRGHNRSLVIFVNPRTAVVEEWSVTGE